MASDLLLGNAMSKVESRGKQAREWKPLFWPDHYVNEENDMTLEGNLLTEAQMRKYAAKATKDRQIFKDRALAVVGDESGLSSEEYLATTERLARKMHKHSPRYEVKHNPCIEPKKTKSEKAKPLDVDSKC